MCGILVLATTASWWANPELVPRNPSPNNNYTVDGSWADLGRCRTLSLPITAILAEGAKVSLKLEVQVLDSPSHLAALRESWPGGPGTNGAR